MKLIQSPWVASGIGLVLYLLITALCWRHPRLKQPDPSKEKTAAAGPSWTFQNPEIDQLIGELKHEREVLAQKEKQLTEFSARLQTERQELIQLTQSVHVLQTEFDRSLFQIEEQEVANLKKLAKVYAGMAPENAISILRQLEESTLVKIFASMKDSERGPLLETLGSHSEADAKLAAAVSERLRLAIVKSPAPQARTR